MRNKFIPIVIGLVLIVGTGLSVYMKKESTQTVSKPVPSNSGITLSLISTHNSRSSCWSAINGEVYDLTSWIPNHPGGEQVILSICGRDGSNDFNGQHGGSRKIATILAGFKIGTLAN